MKTSHEKLNMTIINESSDNFVKKRQPCRRKELLNSLFNSDHHIKRSHTKKQSIFKIQKKLQFQPLKAEEKRYSKVDENQFLVDNTKLKNEEEKIKNYINKIISKKVEIRKEDNTEDELDDYDISLINSPMSNGKKRNKIKNGENKHNPELFKGIGISSESEKKLNFICPIISTSMVNLKTTEGKINKGLNNVFDVSNNKSDFFVNLQNANLAKRKIVSSRSLKRLKKVYDSLSEDEDMNKKLKEIYRKQEANDKYLFKHNGAFKKNWNFLIVILILYNVIISPYKNAFSSSLYIFHNAYNYNFFFEIAIDTFFFLDIIFNFFVPYFDEEENMITSHKHIILHYLKTWFPLDLFSSMPISYINMVIYYYNIQSLALNRIYMVLAWAKVLRIIKLLYNTSYQNNKIYQMFFSNKKSSVVLRLSVSFVITIHIISCVWCYLGKSTNDITYNATNWITENNSYLSINSGYNFYIYISSLYFSLVTVYTIGYGDIFPNNTSERLFVMCFMIVGVLLFSFAISWLSERFSKVDKRTENFRKKLKILEEYMDKYDIPEETYKRIKKNLKYQHFKNLSGRWKFLESLPPNLKNRLVYLMYQGHLKKLKFFENTSSDFLMFIVPLIMTIKLAKEDILFGIGEYVEEMYMVIKGVLALKLGVHYYHLEVAQIWENYHFGEILMYSNEQSPFNLVVKTRLCELCAIRKKHFSMLKMKFPEIVLEKLRQSIKVYRNILQRRKMFIEIISSLSHTNDKEEVKRIIRSTQKYHNSLSYLKKIERKSICNNAKKFDIRKKIKENFENKHVTEGIKYNQPIGIFDDKKFDRGNTIELVDNKDFICQEFEPLYGSLENVNFTKKDKKQINLAHIENNINQHIYAVDRFLLNKQEINMEPLKENILEKKESKKSKEKNLSRGTSYKIKQGHSKEINFQNAQNSIINDTNFKNIKHPMEKNKQRKSKSIDDLKVVINNSKISDLICNKPRSPSPINRHLEKLSYIKSILHNLKI